MESHAQRHHVHVRPGQTVADRRRLNVVAVGAALVVALVGSAVAVAFDVGQPAYRVGELVAAFINGIYAVVGAVVAL